MLQSLLALAAIFLAGLAAEAAPQISVKARIEIAEGDNNREAITLGDLAEFEGFSAARTNELKMIHITDAPQASEERIFTSSSIAQTLRSHVGSEELGEKVLFAIPARVVITRKAIKLNEASVKQAIIDQLKLVCSSCEFKIDRVSLPIVNRLTHKTKWNVKVRSELPRGSFSYPLEVADENGSQTYWVTGQVAILKKALVAKKNIGIGEKINEGDVATELRDITLLHDSIAEQADLQGSVAARGISAEHVIGRTHLKREPAFRFGDVVKVVSGNDSWQISIDGIAQNAASIGEVAKVKIPRTQKLLSGVVIEKGVVEVK